MDLKIDDTFNWRNFCFKPRSLVQFTRIPVNEETFTIREILLYSLF